MRRPLILLIAGIFLPMVLAAEVIDVEAESVLRRGSRIEASGRVVIRGEDMLLKANYVVYDSATEDLFASGNCHLEEEGGELDAQLLHYNIRRKDFRLEQGSVLIYAEPVIISGERITRYGQDVYEGDGITYTPCLGEPPDWSIGAGRLHVPVEGYGRVYHARARVRDIPVFYFPFLLFPAKFQRQSGLLFPELSQSSDYGYRVGVPLYLVLGRSADFTLTPTWLSDRGLMWLGEFRYRLDEDREGFLYGESLSDRMGGEEFEGGVSPVIPDARWLFKASQTGGNLTWDINLVSHADYLRDIGPFYGNERAWKDPASSGGFADDEDREELISRAQWIIPGRGFSASLSGRFKQDLTVEDNGLTLQELPRLRARMRSRKIPYTPVLVSSDMTSVRVYSRDWIEAVKNNAQVGLSLPLSLGPYLTVLPAYREIYRDTHITDHLEAYEDDTYSEHWQERSVLLTTALYSRRFAGGLYHQVVPSASWTYRTRYGGNYDQGDPLDLFPDLLSGDEWEKEHDLSLSLENYIRDPSGRALAELTLSRSYSYIDSEWDYAEARIRLSPLSWLTAQHTNRFDRLPRRSYASIEHWSRLTLRDWRGDELYAAEEYIRGPLDETKSALLGVKAVLGRGFSARYELEYDFLDRRYEHSRQGLIYTSQCWSVDIYREVEPSDGEEPRETTVGLTLNLLGFGQVLSTEREFEAER